MKRILFVSLALVGLCLLATSAQAVAQDTPPNVAPTSSATPPAPPPAHNPRQRGQGVPGMDNPTMLKETLDKALGQLDLTDDQEAAITKIRAEFEPKIKENHAKFDDLMKQMMEARKAGDQEKAGELHKQMQALGNPQGDMMAAITKELKPDQAAKLKELHTPPPPVGMRIRAALEHADELKLTDDQKSALHAMKDKLPAMQRPRRGENAPGTASGSDAMAKILDEQKQLNADFDKILNKEQLAQLKEIMAKIPPQMRGGPGGPGGPGGGRHGGPEAPPPPPAGGPNPLPPAPGGPAGGN